MDTEIGIYKRDVIRQLAKKHNSKILEETGCYKGWMIEQLLRHFDLVYPFELSPMLYDFCRDKFKPGNKAKIFQGNAAYVLPQVLREAPNWPTLF